MAVDRVIDSSVVLASLFEEAGGVDQASLGAQYRLCAVNLAEIVTKLIDCGMTDEEADAALKMLGVTVVPFDRQLAVQTGRLRKYTRRSGLSLGDRACLALALRESLPAMTADRAWTDVDVGVQIELIR